MKNKISELAITEEKLTTGAMYCLDSVLTTDPERTHYIMYNSSWENRDNCKYSVSFGRNRTRAVPEDCYIVVVDNEDFRLEPIAFNEDGVCDYLQKLKEQGINYKIPKSLPPSPDKAYSRFECAIGATHWSGRITSFFGKNGYAVTDVSYVGADRYTSFAIHLNKKPGALTLGGHVITGISGYDIPKACFIEKILMEEVNVEEGEPLIAMLREAGLEREIEHIRFETEEDE